MGRPFSSPWDRVAGCILSRSFQNAAQWEHNTRSVECTKWASSQRQREEAINRTEDVLYPYLYVFMKISKSVWPYIGLLWKTACLKSSRELPEVRKLLLNAMQRQILSWIIGNKKVIDKGLRNLLWLVRNSLQKALWSARIMMSPEILNLPPQPNESREH